MTAWLEPVRVGPAPLEVTPVVARDGREVGVIRDRNGYVLIACLSAERPGPRESGPPLTAELAVAVLARLFEPNAAGQSATRFGATGSSHLQFVLQADVAARHPVSRVTAAYQHLGYHRVPRCQSAWIVLRQETAWSENTARELVERATAMLGQLPVWSEFGLLTPKPRENWQSPNRCRRG